MSQQNEDQRNRSVDFSNEEIIYLLSLIEQHLPITAAGWELVRTSHVAVYANTNRTVKSLRRKFASLYRQTIPIDNPDCPAEVVLAKRVFNLIIDRASTDESDVDGDDDGDADNDKFNCHDDNGRNGLSSELTDRLFEFQSFMIAHREEERRRWEREREEVRKWREEQRKMWKRERDEERKWRMEQRRKWKEVLEEMRLGREEDWEYLEDQRNQQHEMMLMMLMMQSFRKY